MGVRGSNSSHNMGFFELNQDLLDAHIFHEGRLDHGHKDFYDTINNSFHFQLDLTLTS